MPNVILTASMARRLTRGQVANRKAKAVRFLKDVLGDPDRATEVEAESVEDYAARRRFVLANPNTTGVIDMSGRESLEDVATDRDALLDRLEEIRDQIDDALDEYGHDDEVEEVGQD